MVSMGQRYIYVGQWLLSPANRNRVKLLPPLLDSNTSSLFGLFALSRGKFC